MSVKWRTHYRLGRVLYTDAGPLPVEEWPFEGRANVGYQMGFSACGRPRFSRRRTIQAKVRMYSILTRR